jgi:hypothetical protein
MTPSQKMPAPVSPLLGPTLGVLLGRLRRRIRAQVIALGVASLVALLGALFWLSLAIDWLFEPAREVRVGVLVLTGACAAALLYWMLVRKLSVRMSDANLALLIERKFPQLKDSLITAVQLSQRKSTGIWHQQMLAETIGRARDSLRLVELDEVLNTGPATRRGVWATVLLASVLVFAVALPDLFGVWWQRSLRLADMQWPRNTFLRVAGLNEDGSIKVARGGDVTLLVQADAEKQIPRTVEIRYETEDGARGREPMDRIGRAIPGHDEFQDFTYTFEGVLSSRTFDISGGDYRLRDLRIDVVDMPALESLQLECAYPEYTGRGPRKLAAAGATQLPQGTRVTLEAVSSKDLAWAEITVAAGEQTLATERIVPEAGRPRHVRFALDALQTDTTLLVRLHDTDGIENREPLRVAMTVVPDVPPVINAQLAGIGAAVTPAAQLPMRGAVHDDYGVADVRFEYAIGEETPREQSIFQADSASSAPPAADRPLDAALDLRELALMPGQKFSVGLKSRDNFALAAAPHDAAGERYVLDVVSAEDLLQLLQTRELGMRRRFETLLAEATSLRDSLPALSDAPAEGSTEAAGEQQVGLALAIQRLVQLSRKDAQETLGVAASFSDMREELDNNRIDNSELKDRLQTRISDPLERCGTEMFAELDRRLELIRTAAADDNVRRAAVGEAVQQADAILLEMQRVLDQMLELESLNEAVALLREIIATQDQVTEDTKQRRTEKARQLLDEE